jgi:hypothetical protein
MRILIAGLLGAIAMFVWTSIAHVATPLGQAGFSQIPNEAAVLSAMQTNIAKPGLYFFPWVDMKAPGAMQRQAEVMKTNPWGFVIYHPPGASTDMAPLMVEEFAKELAMSLIAALLLSMAAVATFMGRVGFVTLIGVIGALTTNGSYWVWYGFPTSYTLAYMFVDLMSMVVAGAAIAWWFGRKPT